MRFRPSCGILFRSMNVPTRASSRTMASIILIVVIASLCFSVGEGLRLTPFPISALLELGEASSTAKPAEQISNHKYGPLDVPTQHQKRSKRQAEPLDFLVTRTECEVPTTLHSSAAHEGSAIVSVRVVSQFAGRAPPSIS